MTKNELNQNFDQMVKNHNLQPWEVEDNSNLDQCFDLAFGWLDILAIPRSSIRHLNASQIWTDFSDSALKYFDKIPNTPDAVPQKGDVVVFNGQIGHVCVASGNGDTSNFESFDQNWDTYHFHDQNGNPICRLVNHNYRGVLGWLRPRVVELETRVEEDMPPYLKQLFQEQNLDSKNEGAVRDFWQGAINYSSIKKDLEGAIAANKQQADVIASLRADNKSLQSQLSDCQNAPKGFSEPLTLSSIAKLFLQWLKSQV